VLVRCTDGVWVVTRYARGDGVIGATVTYSVSPSSGSISSGPL
jgi:hypothetical protein